MKIENLKFKIIFMGTPHIAAIIFKSLINSPYKPTFAITRPDKPRGRNKKETPSEVKILANKNNIAVFQPQNKLELEEFAIKQKPDLIVVCAFGMIITGPTLEAAKLGAVNVHPSLLPQYRGPSPITAPILNGDKKTGTTIMLMNERMDEGDILVQKEVPLRGNENLSALTEKLAGESAKLLIDALQKWLSGEIKPRAQDHTKASYTKLVKKEDGKIDWQNMTAKEIERMSRAYDPWPGIYTFWREKKIDLFEIKIHNLPLEAGKVTTHKNEILIGTRSGVIQPKYLRIEGKAKISTKEFLRGYPDFKNSILS